MKCNKIDCTRYGQKENFCDMCEYNEDLPEDNFAIDRYLTIEDNPLFYFFTMKTNVLLTRMIK